MSPRVRLPVSGAEVIVVPATGYSDVVAAEAGLGLAGAVAVCQSRITGPGPGPVEAMGLPVTDIDYLVVQLRLASLGGSFVGEGICQACSARVDVSFEAASYLEHCRPRRSAACREAEPGWWQLKRYELSFRVPTAADVLECEPYADARKRLLDRCLRGPRSRAGEVAAERAMATVAPTLTSEVGGRCPECGAAVSLQFDARSFCLSELRAGATSVLADVVTLAGAFHWPEADILALPTRRRQVYVEAVTVSASLRPLEAWVA